MKKLIVLIVLLFSSAGYAVECNESFRNSIQSQLKKGIGEPDITRKLEKNTHHELSFKCSTTINGGNYILHKENSPKNHWYVLQVLSGNKKGFYGYFSSKDI